MKLFLSLCFISILLISTSPAQEVSPELKRKINEAYIKMEHYKRTTPLIKQKIDALLAGGDYFMSIQDWKMALNGFNEVLKLDPKNKEARLKRNYCMRQLKKQSPRHK